MNTNRRGHISYLLRLWQTDSDGLVWLASLENPMTGERRGFNDIDELTDFLKISTHVSSKEKSTDEADPVKEE